MSKEVEVVVVRGATGGAEAETGGAAAVVLLLLTLQPMPSHQVSPCCEVLCTKAGIMITTCQIITITASPQILCLLGGAYAPA